MSGNGGRIDREGLADEALGFPVPAPLRLDQSEQVKRVKLVRGALQHAGVKLRRLVGLAAMLQGNGAL